MKNKWKSFTRDKSVRFRLIRSRHFYLLRGSVLLHLYFPLETNLYKEKESGPAHKQKMYSFVQLATVHLLINKLNKYSLLLYDMVKKKKKKKS